MASFSAGTTFTDGVANDVTAAKLAALVNAATPTSGLIQDRTAEAAIAVNDNLLIGDASDSNNLKRMTVANFRSAATFGTTTSTAATITSGTITTLNSTTGTITTGVIPTLTSITKITSGTGTAAVPAISPTGDANTGFFFPAENTIAFSQGGAEAMRIDSSGNVGVGTASPTSKLHLGSGDIRLENGNYIVWGGLSNGISGNAALNLVSVYTNGTERLRIDSSGNVGIGLTPTSRNNTRLQIVDGIGFPATQVASSDANTLDDYEEGTWTIGVTFGGASVGVTYSANTGQYTKIGNKVSVSGDLTLTASGSSTGNARITGLPFAIRNAAEAAGGVAIGFITSTSFADFPQGFGDIGATTIALRETTNAGANTALTNTDFGNSSRIIFTYTYFV
jgi:hypothetical protein